MKSPYDLSRPALSGRGMVHVSAIVALFLCAVAAFAGQGKPVPPDSTQHEKEIGKEAAKDVESKLKVVDDKENLAKLTKMCKEIGAVSERPLIQYQVKIVDPKVPNAFTLPGGYVYVTKGLLDYVESDHELSGVLAHEIAHNAKLHAMKALARAKKLQLAQLLALGVGIAAGGTSGVNVAVFAQYLTIAVLNGYGVEAEAEADHAAVAYLAKTAYDPVGLLTFLERLSRDESRRPEGPDPGMFRTHPPTPERIEATEKDILALGLPINRGAVKAVPKAIVEPVPDTKDGAVQIRVDDRILCRLTSTTERTAQQRADQTIAAFNDMLRQGLRIFEIRVQENSQNPAIYLRTRLLVEILKSDADLAGTSQKDLAVQWEGNFRKVIWEESINDHY